MYGIDHEWSYWMNTLHKPKLLNWEMERKEELEKMEAKGCYSQLDLQFY